ncbi:hypothetical protein [Paraburkholderia sp. CNPSo 3076]|uniref:hypothetical protein n=1 Tax=Paraburkholderia sp. CNPSo 3076 TaxID=2940936 RepID=UPI003A52347A
MRVGEAINLDRQEFDARNGTLIIREARFNKKRELPLHPTAVTAPEALPYPPQPCFLRREIRGPIHFPGWPVGSCTAAFTGHFCA